MCSTRQRLAALLREQRRARGLTLRFAAERAGLSPSTLSRWEAGACLPRVPELESLLRSLGVGERDVTRILFSLDAPRAAKAVRKGEHDRPLDIPAPSGGELLRALRSNARLSVTALAEALGVSPSTVSRWESCAAHPSPDHVERLLDLVGATRDVRDCLAASGVAKLQVERPPYNRVRLEDELLGLESLVPSKPEDLELRLLKLQSLLWWFRDEAGAVPLLQRAIVVYAEFLGDAERYREAATHAQTVLDSGIVPYGEIGVRAYRTLARSDVYRWPAPRPHLGLYILQRCLSACSLAGPRSAILNDMAEYSWLAGRPSEALDYAQRAFLVNGSFEQLTIWDLEARWASQLQARATAAGAVA